MLLENHPVPALIWQERQIGYTELLARIHQVSQQCRPFDITGGKVAICSENRLEWVYAFYASIQLGCTVVPIDAMSSVEDLRYILDDCEPELVFCSDTTQEVVRQALALSRIRPALMLLDALDPPLAGGGGGAETLSAPSSAFSEPIPEPPSDATLLLIYTSGTTGSPKGVMLSWDNLRANLESVSQQVPIYSPGQRVLVLLPLHHIFPLLGALIAPLFTGGTCVFSPSMAAEEMLRTLNAHQVTIIIGVPRLYRLIAQSIRDKLNARLLTRLLFALAGRLQSPAFSKRLFSKVHARFGGQIRYLVSGGAKLDEEVFRDLTTLGFEVLEGFGMTEAAPMITFTRPGESRLGSAGRPMPCNEVRLVDGEITTRGRNVMQGYYRRPEETAAVIQDGWLHTGDLGFFDAEGGLHISGRKKEILVLENGKNINPVEIETALKAASSLIAEVGVFLHHEMLSAAVVPDFRAARRQGVTEIERVLKEQVLAPYNQRVTPYKRLLQLYLLGDELPKTRLGKLKRFLLPELVSDASANTSATTAVPEPDFEDYRVIQRFLEQQKGRKVSAGDHLELDLGLDSLDRVELQSFLSQTFGVALSEEALMDHPRVGRLAELIRENKTTLARTTTDWGGILRQRTEIDLPRSWLAHNLLRHALAWLARGYFRLSATGLEQLPDGPCILAANHQSFLDGLFVAAFLDNATLKRTYFFAKAKHVKPGWRRFLAARNNVIVLDLDQDLQQALRGLAEVLRRGSNLIIFPEGTRTQDGAVAPFRKTYSILSAELGVPVVPVAISGAWQALPAGSRWPKWRAPIAVRFLPPLWSDRETYDEFNQRVMGRIVAAVVG